MAFFKYLLWDNHHMDLRYTQDEYDERVNITKVYRDDRDLDYSVINRQYADGLRDTQRVINGNRLAMFIIYTFVVFLPALVLSIVQNNILLIGGIIVFTVFAYFVVEAVNQVQINRFLYEVDKDLRQHRKNHQT